MSPSRFVVFPFALCVALLIALGSRAEDIEPLPLGSDGPAPVQPPRTGTSPAPSEKTVNRDGGRALEKGKSADKRFQRRVDSLARAARYLEAACKESLRRSDLAALLLASEAAQVRDLDQRAFNAAWPASDQQNRAITDTSLCSVICDQFVCGLDEPAAAGAAILADWPTLKNVVGVAQQQLKRANAKDGIRVVANAIAKDTRQSTQLKEQLEKVTRRILAETALGEVVDVREAGIPSSASVATFVGSQFQTVITGLAKLIVDRAKREALAWVLDRLSEELCGARTPYNREVRTYWMPSLCALAGKKRATGYGAGSAMLGALEGALRSDLEGMPGTIAGLAVGYVFGLEANESGPAASTNEWLICTPEQCPGVHEVRRAIASAVDNVMRGENPWSAVHDAASRIAAANVKIVASNRVETRSLKSSSTAILACGLSVPQLAVSHEPELNSIEDPLTRAATLVGAAAGLASPCWMILGEGYAFDECPVLKGQEPRTLCRDPRRGIDGVRTERFTVAARLARAILAHGSALAARWDSLRVSVDNVRKVVEGQVGDAQMTALADKLASLSSTGKAAKPSTSGVRALLAEIQRAPAASQTSAAVKVLEETVAFAHELSETLLLVPEPQSGSLGCGLTGVSAEQLRGRLTGMRQRIVHIRRVLQAARLAISEGWGRGLAPLVNEARRLPDEWNLENQRNCAAQSSPKPKCPPLELAFFDHLARYSGLIVALVSAEDSEQVAKAIEEAADPPGGWRRKLNEGATTLSIVAHAGAAGGVEWRRGQYGAQYEDGQRMYAQAPTLMLPLGLEMAWGWGGGAWGVYLPIIDPAAFLQYDIDNNSRLPGPRPLTVLSPGLGIRLTPLDSPFSIMTMAVFRPEFRTWDATVEGPGAHAIQLLVALTVDVTLFELYQR